MAVLAPPVQVVASGAPPFVQVPSGAPPFVVTTGPAPPITIVASGAPPITLFNDDGSLWVAGGAAVGGAALLVGETDGFATDFLYPVDAERVALKSSGSTLAYAVDALYLNASTSSKMVYDVAGTLGWSPHNLLLQSKDASANSSITGGTITADVTAGPFGDVTADQIAFAAGNNFYAKAAAVGSAVVGVTYCGSVWMKAAAPVQIGLRTVSGDGSGTHGVLLAAVTTSWQRFSTFCIAGSTNPINVGLDIRNFVTGDDTLAKTVICADWQINRGTVPTAYLPTTTAARVGLALDYDPVTHAARGLLCEPQATNLMLQSQTFDAASWNKNAQTIAVNAVAAPDGTTTADGIVMPSSGANYIVQSGVTVAAGTTYTFSTYVKNGTLGNNWLSIAVVSSGSWYAWFNLATGAKGSSLGSPVSYNITSVGNGWYRLDLTVVVGSTAANCYYIPCSADGDSSGVNGDGVKPACYPWGAQLEPGTVATSYIPTLGGTVTRAGDQVKCTSAAINHSATAGSWWVNTDCKLDAVSIYLSTSSGGAPIYISTPTSYAIFDGANLVSRSMTSTLGVHKIAAAFQAGDLAITADGLAVSQTASSAVSLLAPGPTIYFGVRDTLDFQINGYIRKLRYVPRRKTNPELVAETV